jgi:hypothetical protein
MKEYDVSALDGLPVSILKEMVESARETYLTIPDCDYKKAMYRLIAILEARVATAQGQKQRIKIDADQPSAPKLTADKVKAVEDQVKISAVCEAMKRFLQSKNKKYGNSALDPFRICSKADATQQILIRMDDKLNRISHSQKLRKNDFVDLIGYGLLLMINMGWTDLDDLVD